MLSARLVGTPYKQARARAMGLLEELGIAGRMDAYPAQLSGGERQRVGVARALMNRPALLLADEPTGALDSRTGEQVMDLLLDLNQIGQTLLIVTHDPRLAERCASRVVHFDRRPGHRDGGGVMSRDVGRGPRGRPSPAPADRADRCHRHPLHGDAAGRPGPARHRDRTVRPDVRPAERGARDGALRQREGHRGPGGRDRAGRRRHGERRTLPRRDHHPHGVRPATCWPGCGSPDAPSRAPRSTPSD